MNTRIDIEKGRVLKGRPQPVKPEDIKKSLGDDNLYKRFLRLFRLELDKTKQRPIDRLSSTIPIVNKETGKIDDFVREPLPSNVRKLKEWYFDNTFSKEENWKDRQHLWKDMYLLFLNNPYIARAGELIADEVVQVDAGNSQPIMVEAKRKQKDFILKFFDKIKLYPKIRPTALNIVKYGNDIWILGMNESGVYDIERPPVTQFDDRIEFTPYRVQQELDNPNSVYGKFIVNYKRNIKRIDQLIKSITNKDNVLSYFKSYLFGYVIGGQCLPPWRVLHFRNETTDQPFAPFGFPLFIYSLAPHNKIEAAQTMKVIAQGMMIPKHVYELNIPHVTAATEKFAQAIEFANLWFNSGMNQIKKEQDGFGETYVTVRDLFDFKMVTPELDLEKIGVSKELVDALIISTFLPRNMIDPNDATFGDSGVSLIEKWKPFGRLIYRIQSIILQQVSQLVKIHMIQSRQFAIDEINFSLSMPYPESQINQDLIANQTSLFDLANNIIAGFSEKFFQGQPVPEEIVKIIYSKFLPYDDSTIQDWFRAIDKAKKEKLKTDLEMQRDAEMNQGVETGVDLLAQPPGTAGAGAELMPPAGGAPAEDLGGTTSPPPLPPAPESYQRKNPFVIENDLLRNLHDIINGNQKLKESIDSKLEGETLRQKLKNFMFEQEQEYLREWKLNRKHFYSSKNVSEDFDPDMLVQFDKEILRENSQQNLKKLVENEKVTEYTFKKKKEKDSTIEDIEREHYANVR